MGSNYAHFLLILETEPAVKFRSARKPSGPIFSGNHPDTSTCRFGNCPAKLLPHAHEGSFRFAGSDGSAYRAEGKPCNAEPIFRWANLGVKRVARWVGRLWHFREKWAPSFCRRHMPGNVLSANVWHQQPMAWARLWTGSIFQASRVHRPFTVSSTETSIEISSWPQKNARPASGSFPSASCFASRPPSNLVSPPSPIVGMLPLFPLPPIVLTRSAEVLGATPAAASRRHRAVFVAA